MEVLENFEQIIAETERYLCKCEQYGIDDATYEREELRNTFSLSSSTHDDIIEEIEAKKDKIKKQIMEMMNVEDDIHTNTIEKNYLIIGINEDELKALESYSFESELISHLESDYEYFYEGYFDVKIQELDEDKQVFHIHIEAEEFGATDFDKDLTLTESMVASIEVLSKQVYELTNNEAIKTR